MDLKRLSCGTLSLFWLLKTDLLIAALARDQGRVRFGSETGFVFSDRNPPPILLLRERGPFQLSHLLPNPRRGDFCGHLRFAWDDGDEDFFLTSQR